MCRTTHDLTDLAKKTPCGVHNLSANEAVNIVKHVVPRKIRHSCEERLADELRSLPYGLYAFERYELPAARIHAGHDIEMTRTLERRRDHHNVESRMQQQREAVRGNHDDLPVASMRFLNAGYGAISLTQGFYPRISTSTEVPTR
jgi:hypothetical protein